MDEDKAFEASEEDPASHSDEVWVVWRQDDNGMPVEDRGSGALVLKSTEDVRG